MLIRVLVLLAACSTLSAAARADSEPSAHTPGVPTFARIVASEGVPPDSLGGRDFWAAFRGAFMRTMLPTERPSTRPAEFTVSVPVSNRFALLEGSGESIDAYRVQLALEWLPPTAPAGTKAKETRVRVSVSAWPPGVDPDVVRLAAARDVIGVKATHDRAALARAVGRNAAILVLEHVHHLNGELPGEERLRLEQATRTTEPREEAPQR